MSQKKLVLILEDVDSYSFALKKLLDDLACTVVVKTTHSDARKFLKDSKPDLIFCDGEAPDGTFFHAIPNHLWGKVIGISGSRGYNETMKLKGAAALVPKMGSLYDVWAQKAVQRASAFLA